MEDEVVEKNDVGDTARSRKELLRKCERCSMNIVLGIVKSILDKMAKWQNEMYI